MDESTRDAVFGNVGSMIAFQVGPDDADELARQLSKYEDQLVSSDLLSLPAFTAYVRLFDRRDAESTVHDADNATDKATRRKSLLQGP